MKQLFVKNHMDPTGSVYLKGFRSTLTHSFLFAGGTYYQLKNLKDTCLLLCTRFTEDILTLIKLMVSAKTRSRKKKRAPSNLRSLRLKLKQKNQDIAPTKHNMCRKIFQAYLKEKHPNKPIPRGMYPTTKRVLRDVIFAGCMDWY